MCSSDLSTDASSTDASSTDASSSDAVPPDATSADASSSDASSPDASSVMDATRSDAVAPDAIAPDAIAPDAVAPDAGAAPEGRVEVVLSSTTAILPSDGTEVAVEASCRYVPSPRLEPAPPLRLQVDSPARLDGSRVLVQRRGIVPVRCETAWPSLLGVASITAVGAALPGAWARAGRPLAAQIGRAHV